MRTPYIQPIHRFDAEEQAERALETLGYIVGCGGTVDRWKGFILLSKMPQAIFDVIEYLNIASTSALEFLSLRWKGNIVVTDRQEQDAMEDLADRGIPEDSHSLAYGFKRPQLRQVELSGLPIGFVFNRVSPMVSNLTNLALIGLESLPPIRGVSALLSASSRLESLCIDMGTICPDYDHLEVVAIAPFQVRLSSLRNLSLDIRMVPKWGLQLLQIVDAPALQCFELTIGSPYYAGHLQDPRKVYRYLGTGRVNGVLQCDIPLEDEHPNGGPIFPLLRHLNLEAIRAVPSTLPLLLNAFPMIAQVTFNLDCLKTLIDHPELLPNVSHFTYNQAPSSNIIQAMLAVASSRANGGIRDIFFEISTRDSEQWRPPVVLGDKGGRLYEESFAPLSELVGKFEVHEPEQYAHVYDSDDLVPYGTDEEDNSDREEETDEQDETDIEGEA